MRICVSHRGVVFVATAGAMLAACGGDTRPTGIAGQPRRSMAAALDFSIQPMTGLATLGIAGVVVVGATPPRRIASVGNIANLAWMPR